jgi:hypothetical protein
MILEQKGPGKIHTWLIFSLKTEGEHRQTIQGENSVLKLIREEVIFG